MCCVCAAQWCHTRKLGGIRSEISMRMCTLCTANVRGTGRSVRAHCLPSLSLDAIRWYAQSLCHKHDEQRNGYTHMLRWCAFDSSSAVGEQPSPANGGRGSWRAVATSTCSQRLRLADSSQAASLISGAALCQSVHIVHSVCKGIFFAQTICASDVRSLSGGNQYPAKIQWRCQRMAS